MSEDRAYDVPFVDSVFHPTDFSKASEQAFAHALAIALVRKAELTILHAGRDYLAEDEWTQFPAVRATLARWGLLPEGSDPADVYERLSLRVSKVDYKRGNPLRASLAYLDEHPNDLIVLATEGREGIPRWLRPSKAERLARRADTLTLFVPNEGRGFVSLEDGTTSVRRVLVPIDHQPDPRPALHYAARAAAALGDAPVMLIVLRVGEWGELPTRAEGNDESVVWKTDQRSGEVVPAILEAAREHEVDLIAMGTKGHEDFLDVLRGSVTEQVLRRTPCPLLAIPSMDL